MVLTLATGSATFSGNLLTNFPLNAEVLRAREKKGVHSATPEFSMKAEWV
jgi:hypothetical protein